MAILYLGMLITVLIAVHVIVVAVARSAVQGAADQAVAAAAAAGGGPAAVTDPPIGDGPIGGDRALRLDAETPDCRDHEGNPIHVDNPARCDEAIRVAEAALQVAYESVIATRPARVRVDEESATVTVQVFGRAFTPVLGSVEVTAVSCAPLDDVPTLELAEDAAERWQC